MTVPTLGKLTSVNLRDTWIHEAYSFTPWLAEHLDLLEDKLGIPLELEGQEVSVGPFYADILARNPTDDSLVLIENQLEKTDHTHLGQIMTYLAGLESHTVVWIAADFCEEHLSALNWLNEHTKEPFSFFAIKVSAVRIGNSPIAPVLETLCQPNQWDRKLQEITKENRGLTPLGQFRKDFWTRYVTLFPNELTHEAANATSSRWRQLEDLQLAISLYLGKDEVGLFVRGPQRNANGKDVVEKLLPYSEQLSDRLGVVWQRHSNSYFWVKNYKADTSQRDRWDELCNWLHKEADIYEATIRDVIKTETALAIPI